MKKYIISILIGLPVAFSMLYGVSAQGVLGYMAEYNAAIVSEYAKKTVTNGCPNTEQKESIYEDNLVLDRVTTFTGDEGEITMIVIGIKIVTEPEVAYGTPGEEDYFVEPARGPIIFSQVEGSDLDDVLTKDKKTIVPGTLDPYIEKLGVLGALKIRNIDCNTEKKKELKVEQIPLETFEINTPNIKSQLQQLEQ